jgi:hypothetical protein
MERFDTLLLACELKSREGKPTPETQFVKLWPQLLNALVEWLVYRN